MPKVESILYDGKKWNRYPEAKRRSDRVYFKRSVTGGTVWLHRYIWEKANGAIPKGFHIHHKDGNTLNNDLSNLACLSVAEHRHEHPDTEAIAEFRVKHLAEIREKASEWHKSADGREWHRKQAESIHFGKFDFPENYDAEKDSAFTDDSDK